MEVELIYFERGRVFLARTDSEEARPIDEALSQRKKHQDHLMSQHMGLWSIRLVLHGWYFIQVTQVVQQVIDRLITFLWVSPDGAHYDSCQCRRKRGIEF